MPDENTPPTATAPDAPAVEPTITPKPAEQAAAAKPVPEPPKATANASGDSTPRPEGVTDVEWSALGDPGKAALVRERQKASAAEAKVREFETRDLSELEKAQREAAENKAVADKATTEALRLRLATRHGISEEDAELFLVGTDEATLATQAERVAALRGTPPEPRIPAPDPGQGARPNGPLSEDDQLYESLYPSAPIRK